jgi:hypothetical protein
LFLRLFIFCTLFGLFLYGVDVYIIQPDLFQEDHLTRPNEKLKIEKKAPTLHDFELEEHKSALKNYDFIKKNPVLKKDLKKDTPPDDFDFSKIKSPPTPQVTLTYSEHNPILPHHMSIVPIRPLLSQGKANAYSIEPKLTDGLQFDSNKGIVSGTPTKLGFQNLFTVTAKHNSGNATCLIKLEVGPPKPVLSETLQDWQNRLWTWYLTNQAAGNYGDYYLNADRGHSMTKIKLHPQVLEIKPSHQKGKVVISNASLGVHGMYSLVRYQLMRHQHQAFKTFLNYRNNIHTWYPSVNDVNSKDPIAPDLSIAMFPYASMSVGKSHSEQDEMHKFFYTLAAFKPEVKETLKAKGLLIPTLQMIFRRTRVKTDQEYLSGKAHPSAFDNVDNTKDMVYMAQGIDQNTLPPITNLKILAETYQNNGFGFHNDLDNSEHLFTTPHAIARVYRGIEAKKIMIVDLSSSYDINHLSLKPTLKVLRGDPNKVRIEQNPNHPMIFKITIPYHTSQHDSYHKRDSNLVVIGAFTHNGYYYSAPSFITSFSLNNESRHYLSNGQLLSIQYLNKEIQPNLSHKKTWKEDVMLYDVHKKWTGWKRNLGDKITTYNSDGLITQGHNALEKPLTGKLIRYQLDKNKKYLNLDSENTLAFEYKYHQLQVPQNGQLSLASLFPSECQVLTPPKHGRLMLKEGHLVYLQQQKQVDQFKLTYRTSKGTFISEVNCLPTLP